MVSWIAIVTLSRVEFYQKNAEFFFHNFSIRMKMTCLKFKKIMILTRYLQYKKLLLLLLLLLLLYI